MNELFTGLDRYCIPPADTIPEKPRRGRRCPRGTKHPYDGEAERGKFILGAVKTRIVHMTYGG